MSLTTTTLASAAAASDTSLTVSSATGFAAGNRIVVDGENFTVTNSYVSGTSIPVLRGQNGTVVSAHVASANVTTGLASDFANAGPQQNVTYPTAGRVRTLTSYTAAGAITLPTPGCDAVAVINGTSTIAMTLAAPTKDMDGSILTVIGNGKSSSTVTAAGGFGLASTGYTAITLPSGAQSSVQVMACNAAWVLLAPPWSGTTTAIVNAIA